VKGTPLAPSSRYSGERAGERGLVRGEKKKRLIE
jgi:hypothetical protein